ncbi:TPA: glycosyltransferase [Candidatus Micrarchaeota archaeon]|nr:glycosyltransferase [Candidatus Micrarchaeota archaeon]
MAGVDGTGISIVLPTLNEEKNLAHTLHSLKKMFPKAEIVVADGGSKDDTMAIASKAGVKVCLEKVKKGNPPSIGAGRNTGAREATREYLFFCDADNVPPKLFFERAVKAFEDPGIVGFGGKVMPNNATFLQNWVFEVFNLIVQVSGLLGQPVIAGNAAAYKRKQFFAAGGFDEEMQASEDQDLCRRIGRKGKVVYDKQVVTYTSNRRLKKFGLMGLLLDWGKTTLNFLLGIKTKRYAIIREI